MYTSFTYYEYWNHETQDSVLPKQVRFAELIILLRFSFFMAIGYQYVCCYEVPRLQHGELDWWRKKWCSFHRFKPQIVQHVCPCVHRLVFLLLLCLLCLFLINESFLGGLETEMQHERMESKQSLDRKFQKKTDSLSWNGGWNWGAAQDQWTILCVQSPS